VDIGRCDDEGDAEVYREVEAEQSSLLLLLSMVSDHQVIEAVPNSAHMSS